MNKLGRLFSTIVFQNIAAIIAVGIIKNLFGEYGWFPNEEIYQIVDPMYNLLLPLLIGYTGGKVIGGGKSGVIAAIAILGLIISSPVSMIMGAMIIGPLVGWINKKVEEIVLDYLPIGLELLIGNLIGAIIATTFMMINYYIIGPFFTNILYLISQFIQQVGSSGLLPLLALVIEPGKVFFLNNIMNHGILSPIAMQQAKEAGKSIFFLVESNLGPGLGVLLAYLIKSPTNKDKNSIKAAIGIHAIGGVHEVYFPYILMKPILLLPVMAGGITGIAFFQFSKVGLVTTPSPGSILFLVGLAPKTDMLFVFLGILLSTIVSFVIAFFLLKKEELSLSVISANGDISEGREIEHKIKPKLHKPLAKKIETIVFACDGGMASSATGAAFLRKRVKAANLHLNISHSAVDAIPADADMVVTHKTLKQRAEKSAPQATIYVFDTFTDLSVYDNLLEILREQVNNNGEVHKKVEVKSDSEMAILIEENQIMLDCKADSKEEAITLIGERMVELGYVTNGYIEEMLDREKMMSTYIGNGVALPHGFNLKSTSIIKPGFVIAQFRYGIKFNNEIAYLLIGISGVGDQQVRIISSIAGLIEEKDEVKLLINTRKKEEFLSFLRKIEMYK
ncbi:PTS sugar transporter subunit IIA [Bacillus sp. FJAT-50079]|uniref:PTS sugar transporter subunit IIA n=1 Tax=Bacillus sp. FJAT-50079 TaxID=2833577 RepID=UPI001BC95DC8|nr:PTS sugar transporter subunit IIA [Bacillus sp. FJAT-50079]MBS4206866.1 PTS sugar transporter subunit IIA [Bacillus sp. FJAT-50079]